MMQHAGDAAIKRWFVPSTSSGEQLIIWGSVQDFYYNHFPDTNGDTPITSAKIRIRAELNGKSIVDKEFESGDQYGKKFRGPHLNYGVGKKYETHFTRATYKALTIALDNAMHEVSRRIKQSEAFERKGQVLQ